MGAIIALAGVLAAACISSDTGTNVARMTADSQVEQLFIQQQRQAYSDFYAALLSVIAIDSRSDYTSGPIDDPELRLQKYIVDHQAALADLRTKQATVELVGSVKIGDIADDIVKVRTWVGIVRSIPDVEQIPSDTSTLGFTLETYDKNRLDTTGGDEQLYENFLAEARIDLRTNEVDPRSDDGDKDTDGN